MTNRISTGFAKVFKAFWPSNKPSSAPAMPMPLGNDENASPETAKTGFMLISVIGMEATARDQMLDWMVADCKANGRTPVFITDDLDLTPWIERQLLVEHLPSLERQTNLAPDLDWDLYLKRRLAQIKRKWRASEIADLGGKLGEIAKLGPGQETADQNPTIEPIGRQG